MNVIKIQARYMAWKLPLRKPSLSPLRFLTRRSKTTASTSSGIANTLPIEPAKQIPTPGTLPPLPIWQRLGPLSVAFNSYARAQGNRPYVTQIISSLVIYLCGDTAAQLVAKGDGKGDGDEGIDIERVGRCMVIGGFASLPSYTWFMMLGNRINFNFKVLSLAGNKILSISTIVLVNQIIWAPLFNCYFFGMQCLLSGGTVEDTWERIKRTVPQSWINSCKLWPAVTAFSFWKVLPQYRSVFAGVIAIGWQTYLSWLNRQAELEALHKSE